MKNIGDEIKENCGISLDYFIKNKNNLTKMLIDLR